MSWVVVKEGKIISKRYPHKIQAVIHAFELKLVFTGKGSLYPAVDFKQVTD